MAKRFTDTEIWDKQWFMDLSPRMKCFVKYVRDKCDVAGIWYANYILASVYIGEHVSEDELLGIDNGEQFVKISEGKIHCVGLAQFQYGENLSYSSPIHKKVIDILDKFGIKYNVSNRTQRKFDAPTIEEIESEMVKKTNRLNAKVQADKFFNYYDSNSGLGNDIFRLHDVLTEYSMRSKILPK